MKFPNAKNGVNKIFKGEILSLIESIVFAIAIVFGIIAVALIESGKAEETVGATFGIGIGFLVFLIASIVLSVISFILILVGDISAMKDEAAFKTALIFAVAGIAASVATAFFTEDETMRSFIQTFKGLVDLFAIYFVVEGIINLAGKLNDRIMVERGQKVRLLLTVSYCVSILASMIAGILSANGVSVVANVLALVAALLSVFVYFFYLGYLKKAVKMLEA